MGGAADETTQVVTVDDVTVEKHLKQDHPQRVAVSFEIRSNRQDSVRLRLRDSVPRAFTVGFHPEFGGENWSRNDQSVEFQRVLDGGETCRTAYGVGNISEADVSQLSEEPSLEVSSLIEEPCDPLLDSQIGEESGPLGGFGDLDLDLSMDDGEGFDLSDAMFDDTATVASPTDDPHAGDEGASDSEEDASSSILDEAGVHEDEECSFEQNSETEADPLREDSGTKTQPSQANIEPSGLEVTFPSEQDEEDAESLQDSEAVGQPTADAKSKSPGWISASLKETIQELEAATAELAGTSTGRRTTLAELQDQVETLQDQIGAMEGSLETVEDQSTYLSTVFEELDDSIRTLESTIMSQEPIGEPVAPELYATISDIAEEISLIKSSLASNLETAYQHRTDLNEIEAEIEQTGDTVETMAERSQSITDELASIRELLRANAESLEVLETNQLALQDAMDAMQDRLAALDDRVEEIAESTESVE